jgi:hypothetical protein
MALSVKPIWAPHSMDAGAIKNKKKDLNIFLICI